MTGHAKSFYLCLLLWLVSGHLFSNDSREKIQELLVQSEKLWLQGESEEALSMLNPIVDSLLNQEEHDQLLVAQLYQSIGKYTWRSKNPDYRQALQYLQKCLELRREYYSDDHLEIANALFYLGSLYRYGLNDIHNAELSFRQCIRIRKHLRADNYDLVRTYYNLATTYRLKGDVDQALPYGLMALNLCKQISNPQLLATCYGMVANIYFDKTEFDIAKDHYRLSLSILDSLYGAGTERHVGILNNLGNAHLELLEYQPALNRFREALYINQESDPGGWNQSTSYLNIGFYYFIRKRADSSLHNYRKCLNIRAQLAAGEPSHLTLVYQRLGDLHHQQLAYDSALYYYQDALISAVSNFSSKAVKSNPELLDIKNQTTVFDILAKKAWVLADQVNGNPVFEVQISDIALLTFHLADKLLSENRRSFKQEGSQLILSNHAKGMYENAVDLCYRAYSMTNESKFIEEALFFMEKSKASILTESMILLEQNKSILPEELIQKKNQIESEILLLRAEEPHHAQENGLSDRFIKLMNSKDSIINYIQQRHPDYYNIKYDSFMYDINTVKTFSSNQKVAIIEYFMGEKSVYAIAVQGNQLNFRHVGNSAEIRSLAEQIVWLNKTPLRFGKTQTDFNKFREISHSGFLTIFGRMIDIKQVKSLLVIPDGVLGQVPFESFLVSRPANAGIDYQNLHYLIKDVDINYTYSLRLQFNLLTRKDRPSFSSVFAMGYSGTAGAPNQIEIPNTAREIQGISNIINTTYYLGRDASKERYVSEAPEYSIIHLGAHGFIDEANPLKSGLRFQGQDYSKDDTIYLYEIYSQPLNASLVVLAACETGTGLYYEGEGTYSLGRAFAYAGTNSVVQSLWKIDDEQSSKVVEYFYKYLSRGLTVSRSLQKSKLKYLSEVSGLKSHPSYWAGLIPMGVNQAILTPFITRKQIGIMVILIAALGSIIYLYRRRIYRGP